MGLLCLCFGLQQQNQKMIIQKTILFFYLTRRTSVKSARSTRVLSNFSCIERSVILLLTNWFLSFNQISYVVGLSHLNICREEMVTVAEGSNNSPAVQWILYLSVLGECVCLLIPILVLSTCTQWINICRESKWKHVFKLDSWGKSTKCTTASDNIEHNVWRWRFGYVMAMAVCENKQIE